VEIRKADPQGAQNEKQLFVVEGRLPVQAVPESRHFDVEAGCVEEVGCGDSLTGHLGANLVRYPRSSEAVVTSAVVAVHMAYRSTYGIESKEPLPVFAHVSYAAGMASGTKPPPGVLSEALGEILRAQIARKKLKQSDIAAEMGISQTQLSGIVNAKKHVDIEQLDQLCWVIGLEFWEVVQEADNEVTDRQLSDEWTARSLVHD
jgi:plasmid maintenance system antidote protein VapI